MAMASTPQVQTITKSTSITPVTALVPDGHRVVEDLAAVVTRPRSWRA